MRENVLGNRRPGVFHQRKRRHAEALAGGTVNGPHFRRSDDLHVEIVAALDFLLVFKSFSAASAHPFASFAVKGF